MPPSKVYLIGEEHVDLRKLARYRRAFERFQPDVISTELSEDLFKSVKEYIPGLVKQFQIPANRIATVQELFLAGGYAAAEHYFRVKDNELKIIFAEDEDMTEAQQAYYQLVTWEKLAEKPTFYNKVWFAALEQRLIKRRDMGDQLIDAQTYSLVDLLQQNDRREIARVSRILDCLYFDEDVPEDDPNCLLFNLPQRNTATIEKLMTLGGAVVHGGGGAHVFGENSLYDQLQERDISVERFSLLDFAFSSFEKSQQYRQEISNLEKQFR